MSRPTHAVVSLAALDVRRRPEHRSELTSQLLLGEVVRLLGPGRDGQWWRVKNLADAYRGWVRSWGLVPVPRRRALSWQGKAAARVAAPFVEVTSGPGRGALVSPLFLNSRVIAGRRRGRFRPVELPDGRRGWVRASALVGRRARVSLLSRVRSLMGVPYLWGGRTPCGFDCSGFAQQVMAEQGLSLPRDAVHQRRISRRLQGNEDPRPGDLAFFGTPGQPAAHVGIGLGGGYYAHCRGFVRISSLDGLSPICDNELATQFRGWARPVGRARDGPRRSPPGGESA